MSNSFLVDTGILIGFYNRELYKERYLELIRSDAVFFSAVSLNEFIRGAHDPRSKELVKSFANITVARLLAPSVEQWLECGTVAQDILRISKRPKESVVLMQNDILIALTA